MAPRKLGKDVARAPFRKKLSPVQQRIQQAALRLFAQEGVNRVNVSELAEGARVARGTIYNNQRASVEEMFQEIATGLSVEMQQRVDATIAEVENPVERLATGMRLFVVRAHEEPDWGAFIVRFAMNTSVLREMWDGTPQSDLARGIGLGCFKLRREQLPSAITMIASSVLGAMFMVLQRHRSWRKAGSDVAELTLRALGVPAGEAREFATADLPALVPLG